MRWAFTASPAGRLTCGMTAFAVHDSPTEPGEPERVIAIDFTRREAFARRLSPRSQILDLTPHLCRLFPWAEYLEQSCSSPEAMPKGTARLGFCLGDFDTKIVGLGLHFGQLYFTAIHNIDGNKAFLGRPYSMEKRDGFK